MTKAKFTKKEMFNALIAKIAVDDVFKIEYGDSLFNIVTGAKMIQMLEHEIELLNRKRTSKKDAEKEAMREHYKQIVYDIISKEEKPICIADIQSKNKELAELKNQAISYVLGMLVDDGMVYRTTIKRRVHFTTDITKVKDKQKKEEE